jgi:predicted component of type VI protein secretion system
MNLVIRAVSLAGAPLAQPIMGRFDARGGTIGRTATNTLALPDTERHVSRLQAEVSQSAPGGGFVIRNASTTNGFLLNHQRIAPGQAHVLADGDELHIGTYVLKVELAPDRQMQQTIALARPVGAAHPMEAPVAQTLPAARLRAGPMTDIRTSPSPPPPAAVSLFPLPDVVAPAPHEPPAAPQVVVSTPDPLWAAFCEGAGIALQPPHSLSPEAMRVAGQILRCAVDGTQRLMVLRAAHKQDLQAKTTVIQAAGNNPLKFVLDGQEALQQLLQPSFQGFLAGPQAMEQAMDDLFSHAVGAAAGLRAALDTLLERLEPDATLSAQAREDFHAAFGRAFLQACEQQLEQLQAQRRSER